MKLTIFFYCDYYYFFFLISHHPPNFLHFSRKNVSISTKIFYVYLSSFIKNRLQEKREKKTLCCDIDLCNNGFSNFCCRFVESADIQLFLTDKKSTSRVFSYNLFCNIFLRSQITEFGVWSSEMWNFFKFF